MTIQEGAERFRQLVNEGIEAWYKAGKLLVQMIDLNPAARNLIMQKCPTISMSTIAAFEKIGRRQIYPYLLLESCVAAKKLLEMPADLQEKYLNEPVEILYDWANGKPKTRKLNIRSLTKSEADLVFSSKGARTIEEQRLILFPYTPQEGTAINRRAADLTNGKSIITPTPKAMSKVIGRFSVRRGVGGGIAFEKTNAMPDTRVRVELLNGVTVIEIIEADKSE